MLNLFYLLLFLLPTQLGRHFFFSFSLISGIRSDYLSPTIYLTDVIIGLMIGIWIGERIKNKFETRNTNIRNNDQNSKDKNSKHFKNSDFRPLNLFRISIFGFRFFVLIIFYLLFTGLFIASNKWVALYKLVKIVEFSFLGLIIYRLKPKFSICLSILAFDVIYISLIGFAQFILQRSIGGVFWFLGERSFYAGTPGIAAAYIGGKMLLRPYSIFPHPNVFAGFLSAVLPLISFQLLYRRAATPKIIYLLFWISFVLGLGGLMLSFSRAAWIVALLGLFLILWKRGEGIALFIKKNKNFSLSVFYTLIILSIVIPFTLSTIPGIKTWRSWNERTDLVKTAITIFAKQPISGIGLNNFIVQSQTAAKPVSDLYIFQPVHNIYLLILIETGLVGFTLLLIGLGIIFYRSLLSSLLITLSLTQFFLLGFFDHYLFTLQQGQLLFTLFASLAFLSDNK